MEHDDAAIAAQAITALAGRLARDPHVGPEMQRARREFFAAGAPSAPTAPGAADAADLRFHEWFTLERESEVLGAVPASIARMAGDAAEWLDSMAGLWLVQDVTPRTVEARDLQDGQTIDLSAPPGTLRAGDLVVGRLFAEGAGRWTPSSAAAIFRPGSDLAQAFLRDLQRLELDRRLQQIELEHLLLRRPDFKAAMAAAAATDAPTEPEAPLEHLEADLDRLLATSGSEHSASAISQQLAMSVRPGAVIGPLLDELAFDTEVDLDALRQLLLAIWNAHHRGSAGTPAAPAAAPGESLGEKLVRTLDEGLAQKRDVEELFAQLERMAGIEPDPEDAEAIADEDADEDGDADEDDARARSSRDDEDEDEDDAEADAADEDDGGNLAALVEEYLWETDRTETPAADLLRLFAALQRNAALPHRDLEEITSTDVMRLLLHVYLAAPPAERAHRVLATFEQLQSFYLWATEVQEMDVGAVLAGCRGAMLEQVERLQQASLALSDAGRGAARPGVLVVEHLGPKGFGCRDDDGGDHWVDASPSALASLRVGDLVLGALAPATAGNESAPRRLHGLVVVLPAEARALME